MTLQHLPKIQAFTRPEGISADINDDTLSKWAKVQMSPSNSTNIIDIYEVIGVDWWTGGGFTEAKMAEALSRAGNQDVTVNINSPGGDFFVGVAIYNMLVAHPAKVTIKIMGYAASAASIIAMAGDEVQMGVGSFLMIHNAWLVASGNRHDLRAVADSLEPFDRSMVGIYEARTGLSEQEIAKMMDAETWLDVQTAIDFGFADSAAEAVQTQSATARADIAAKRSINEALAASGFTRSERRTLLKSAIGTHNAAEAPATHNAGELAASIRSLIQTLKS